MLKKIPYLAIIFSLFIHGATLSLFSTIKIKGRLCHPQAEIQLFMPAPQNEDSVVTPPSTGTPKPLKVVSPEPIIQTVIEHVVLPDSVAADSEKFDRLTFFTHAPSLTLQLPVQDVQIASSDTLMINPAAADISPFAALKDTTQFNVFPGPYPDRIQRHLDHPPTLPLNRVATQGTNFLAELFNRKKEIKPIRLDYIPSETELAIFSALWESSTATDREIYAALDTTIHLTAEDMQDILARLAQKGLVKRTLVSPRNELTLPIGTIEMSGKNRRNRIYEYKALIHSADVLRYLDAVLYEMQLKQKSLPADSMRAKDIVELKEKILRLLQVDE